jgi:hypothetical protein
MYFTHNLQFPNTKIILNFKELTCKQCFSFIKINNLYSAQPENRLDYHDKFLEILEESIKEKDKLYNLNIIEFLMLCIRLRTISISSTMELSFEENNKTSTKIIVNFLVLLQNVLKASKVIEKYKNISHENIEISLNWPLLKYQQHFMLLKNEDNFMKFLNSLPLFIETIKIKENLFNFNTFDFDQRKVLLESLPASVKNIIQTNVLELLKEVSSYSLFDLEQFKEYTLEFFNGTIQDIIRFIFSGTEDSEMIEMSFFKKFNFTMDEIYQMSPFEKNNYINYLTQSLKQET